MMEKMLTTDYPARHRPQPKSEKGELNRQAQSRQEENPRVFSRGFRWFRHGARMGEENSIAFLIRAHPRNPRFNSAFTWRFLATWRFNWIPFERRENLRSPRKSQRVAAGMSTDKNSNSGIRLYPVYPCYPWLRESGFLRVLRALRGKKPSMTHDTTDIALPACGL
jgi:hypothetical protein